MLSMSLPPSQPSGQADPQPSLRLWTRRVPWGTLAVLVASGAYLAFFYRIPICSTDEGMIASGAERILRGQIPYRDFFTELGPVSFYLQAGIFRLWGMDVSAFRFTAWILGAVISTLIYILGKQIIRGPGAWAPPFIFITTCYSIVYYVNHHWWGNLFFLLTVICFAVQTKRAGDFNRWVPRALLLAAGLLAALTLLSMQPKGAWVIFMGVAFLILAEKLPEERTWFQALRRGSSRSLWFLLGAGSTMGLAVGYFWLHGALDAWVFDNFIFLFTNYLPYETWPGIYSWVRFTHVFHWLVQEPSLQNVFYFAGFYFFSVVGPAIGFAGAIWQIKRHRAADGSRARLFLLYLLVGCGSLVSELHEPNILHLVWASPIILILFVEAWDEGIREWSRWRRPLIAAAGMVFAMVILVAHWRVTHVAIRNSPIRTRHGTVYANPESAAVIQKWVDTIEQSVPAGRETFIFPYDAQFYFLTATRNPTRYDVLLPGFHSAQQIEEAISGVQTRQPGYVFSFGKLVRGTPRAQFPDDPPDFIGADAMEKSLQAPQSRYQKAGEVEGMEVWVLKK